MKGLLCAWAVLGCIGCGVPTLDRTKFQAVDRAGQLLRRDLNATNGLGSSRFPELLRQFQTEIAALDGRTHGRNEADLLNAYAAASDSYRYFLRFQAFEVDSVGEWCYSVAPIVQSPRATGCGWRTVAAGDG